MALPADLTDQYTAIDLLILTPSDGGANGSDITRQAYVNVRKAIEALEQAVAQEAAAGFYP